MFLNGFAGVSNGVDKHLINGSKAIIMKYQKITKTGISVVVLFTHLLKPEDTLFAPHNCPHTC